jgi:hypothetical protein
MNYARTIFYVSAIASLSGFLMAGDVDFSYTFLFAFFFALTVTTLIIMSVRNIKHPGEPIIHEWIFFGIIVLLAVLVKLYIL